VSIHTEPFEGAGATFVLAAKGIESGTIRVEDWWDRVYGESWAWSKGNPAAMAYGVRTGVVALNVPGDDEVVYGKVDGRGFLVHVSELKGRAS
jgi:hypothetical protein